MRKIIILFLISVPLISFSQKNISNIKVTPSSKNIQVIKKPDCNFLIETIYDKVTGDTYTLTKSIIPIGNRTNNFSISMSILGDEMIAVNFIMEKTFGCIDKDDIIYFLFRNGDRFNLNHQLNLNCKGRFNIILGNTDETKVILEKLTTNEIETVRIINNLNISEVDLSKKESHLLKSSIYCLNERIKNNNSIIAKKIKINETSEEENEIKEKEEKEETNEEILEAKEEKKENVEIYTAVEQNAEFVGGNSGWNNYILKNLKYPKEALKLGVSGKIYVQFVVNILGEISNPVVINSIGHGIDEEAIRLITNSPNWIPAKHENKIVNSRFTIPITFNLPEQYE